MLTLEYINQCVSYDPESGIFVWKSRPLDHFKGIHGMRIFNSQCAQKVAGSITSDGYLEIGISKEKRYRFYLHRLALFITTGEMPLEVDHINGIRTDNRLCNLRNGNRSLNNENLKKARRSNKLGILGVCFNKSLGLYVAQLAANKEKILISYHKTPEEAEKAYLAAKRKYHRFNTL